MITSETKFTLEVQQFSAEREMQMSSLNINFNVRLLIKSRADILQPQSHFLSITWVSIQVNCCNEPKFMVFPKWDTLILKVF